MSEADETRAGKGFDVGKILLEARTKKGISQADISKSLEKVGIILSQKSYSNLEKNTIGRPNVAVVKALEKILEVKLMQLYYPHSDINETQDDENQRISSSKELNNVLSSLSTKDDNDMIEYLKETIAWQRQFMDVLVRKVPDVETVKDEQTKKGRAV